MFCLLIADDIEKKLQKYYTYTNSVSCIERGDDDEPTQACYQYVEEREEEATKSYD
jgi:hypothetical protein